MYCNLFKYLLFKLELLMYFAFANKKKIFTVEIVRIGLFIWFPYKFPFMIYVYVRNIFQIIYNAVKHTVKCLSNI